MVGWIEAEQKKSIPDNWPNSSYPLGTKKNGKMGCQVEMATLLGKYKKSDLVIKIKQIDSGNHLGSYGVGSDITFSAVIGPKNERTYGSVKHGRDRGYLEMKMLWTESKGGKVVDEDYIKKNPAGC